MGAKFSILICNKDPTYRFVYFLVTKKSITIIQVIFHLMETNRWLLAIIYLYLVALLKNENTIKKK